jgi:chaperone required for assembly of F1-ATPase
MKRFYTDVGVTPNDDGTFTVNLDGRPVHSPARAPLNMPSRAVADAVAEEWDAQTEKVDPSTMAIMRFAATAIDQISLNRDAVIDEIAGYGGSDLLCHRADSPVELVQRQEQSWQPLLDWASERHGAQLIVTSGVMPVTQTPEALAGLRAGVAAYDNMALAALHGITSITGSLVLGLAVAEHRLDGVAAWEASRIDEAFQAEQWGEDDEASARREGLKSGLLEAVRFLELL